MVRVLVRQSARVHRVPLAVLAAGLALFEWLMTFVAGQPSVARFLGGALRAAPPELLALLNQDVIAGVSARGIVGIGYTHPFALLMMGAWAVRVPCGALAGEIGRGTVDLVASRPVRRTSQVAAAAETLAGGLAVLALAAWLGTVVGLVTRPLEGASPLQFLPVAAALWLLFAALGMVALFVSALSREAGTAIAWSAGIFAGSYVLDYAARVWPRIAALRPISLFGYYEPQRLMSGGLAAHTVLVPAAVGAAALLLAFVVFARRDL
jgi:beta-exotoxin I transport system permease protein